MWWLPWTVSIVVLFVVSGKHNLLKVLVSLLAELLWMYKKDCIVMLFDSLNCLLHIPAAQSKS